MVENSKPRPQDQHTYLKSLSKPSGPEIPPLNNFNQSGIEDASIISTATGGFIEQPETFPRSTNDNNDKDYSSNIVKQLLETRAYNASPKPRDINEQIRNIELKLLETRHLLGQKL